MPLFIHVTGVLLLTVVLGFTTRAMVHITTIVIIAFSITTTVMITTVKTTIVIPLLIVISIIVPRISIIIMMTTFVDMVASRTYLQNCMCMP